MATLPASTLNPFDAVVAAQYRAQVARHPTPALYRPASVSPGGEQLITVHVGERRPPAAMSSGMGSSTGRGTQQYALVWVFTIPGVPAGSDSSGAVSGVWDGGVVQLSQNDRLTIRASQLGLAGDEPVSLVVGRVLERHESGWDCEVAQG